MGTRLTVFNQKGGVGKTTTTLNLGAALARQGLAPVLVDLDAQAHLTSILNPDPISSSRESVFALYSESKPLAGIARPVSFGGQLLPAHTELIKIDSMFGKGPDVLNRLKNGLDAGYERSQAVVIDCCPMLGVLSLSAVFASERVLVPVSADYLAMKGAMALEKTLRALEHVLKHRVERRYVLTRFDSRRRLSHDIAAQLTERYGVELCETRIAESVGIAESPAFGKDVFSHAPDSRGAQDYAQLLEELRSSGFWNV
jgi:chromosome partitioning protein